MISLFCLAQATAQERNGVISGRVTDSTHAILQGARVELQPTGQTTASNSKGDFAITGLAAGHYTVTITYVGFTTFSKDVDVSASGTANVDATLAVEAKGEEVTVTAGREHGEIEALNRQRTADNILQVLPSEVITSLPNTNIADAVGRLPSVSLERDEGEGKYVQIRGTEPRLSNVTVDGVHLPSPENVRNVKLDAIPSDLVDSVEVSKTLSANQDGDAIGGSVNLVTKSATDEPYVSLLGMGGYTHLDTGRWLDQFSGTAGQRFGKDKKLGVLFGGSYDWNGRGINDIEPSVGFNSIARTDPATGQALLDSSGNPVPTGTFFPGPNGYDYRDYWYDRTRYGFGGTVDYKLGEFSSIYARGLFSEFNDFGQDWIYSPAVGNFLSPTLTDNTGSSSFAHVTRKPEQRIFNVVTGARHDIGKTIINYELSLGQARFTGIFPSAGFVVTPGGLLDGTVQYAVNTANPHTPHITPLNANIFDPTQYVLDTLTQGDAHTFERDIIGSVDAIRQYSVGSHYGSFEIGAKVRDARKSEFNNEVFYKAIHTTAVPGLLESDALGTFTNRNYYLQGYPTFGPTTNFSKIQNFFNTGYLPGNALSKFQINQRRTITNNVGGDFNETERVYAGYVMNTINFENIRIQAGVRIEGTSESFLASSVSFPSDFSNNNLDAVITPVPGTHDYIDVLPSIQIQSSLDQNTIVRAGYGMGISRPNFGDLPPKLIADATNTANRTVQIGNPALKPEHAQNFDLEIEHYLKPFGVISGGVFYKYLTNPIFPVKTTLTTGQFTGFFQTQPINGGHAHIVGFEFSWQQHLSFLPGPLNGLGVRTNYSYTQSQTNFPIDLTGAGRTDRPALLRQAPNNANFDLTYDKKGFSGRIGVTHNDANIFSYGSFAPDGSDGGPRGPNGDTYLYPHTQVDAQMSYWIPKGHGTQAIVSLLNMNNEVFGFYQGSGRYPIQREFYDRTVSFGLRWTLTREPK
ncbi:MAG TPA: TonB-dependent receptor [Terriglobales bacterium]|nr:TonB-dependent receptor [Terriglobales bacterium]